MNRAAARAFRLLLHMAWMGLCCTIPAAAQSAFDDVDECDLLAAHPQDPERMAEGVADDAIVPRLAILACDAAAKRSPDAPRFTFQLGRALLTAGRQADAVAQFRKASEKDYGAASAYLGDAYQFGHGVEVSADRAMDAYRKAVAKGFSPAEGQIEMLKFDPSAYVLPLVRLLYDGDMESFKTADREAKAADKADMQAYIFSFAMAIGGECGAILKPDAVHALHERRYLQPPPAPAKPDDQSTPPDDDSPRIGMMESIAEYDAKTFLKKHGCEGPVATRVKTTLNQLYQNQPGSNTSPRK